LDKAFNEVYIDSLDTANNSHTIHTAVAMPVAIRLIQIMDISLFIILLELF